MFSFSIVNIFIIDHFKNKQNGNDISLCNIYESKEVSHEDLLVGHSQEYLSSLKVK